MFCSLAMPVKMRPDAGSIYSSISMWSGEKEQWSSLVVHLCLVTFGCLPANALWRYQVYSLIWELGSFCSFVELTLDTRSSCWICCSNLLTGSLK